MPKQVTLSEAEVSLLIESERELRQDIRRLETECGRLQQDLRACQEQRDRLLLLVSRLEDAMNI